MIEHEKLPGVIIDPDGSVFSKENGEPVNMVNGQYKLVTSEIFTTMRGKRVNIIRRFSKDDIKKYYHSVPKHEDKSVDTSPVTQNTDKKIKSSKAIDIDGQRYESASEASKSIGVSVNTILNRCKGKKFSNYKFI